MSTKEPSGSAGRAASSCGGEGRLPRRSRPRGQTRDIAERERTPEPVLAPEALLRALIENSPDAIYVKDTQSRWLMANPAVLRIVGLSAQEALGKTDLELYADPKIGQAILENDRRILEGRRPETFEEWADTPDGRRLFLSTKAPWFDAKGDVVGLIGISHDITERRKAEEQLSVTLESIGDGFIAVDGEWRFVYVNASAERLLGFKREDILGKSHWEIFPLTLGTEIERRYRLAAGGQAQDWENFYGPWGRWFHNRCFPRAGGGMVVYFQDITERKTAEERQQRIERDLAEANRQKTDILESISECFYALDKDLRFTYVNKAAEEVWGLSRADLIGRKIEDVFAGRIDFSLEKFHQVLEERTPQHYEVYSKVVQRWGHMSVYPTREGISVYFQDSTERRRAEAALRLSEDKFSKAFRNSPNAITITRLSDGRIIEGNESAYELFGYSPDEVIGKTTADLEIWADPGDRQKLVHGLASRGFIRNEEFALQRKDKSRLSVNLSASLITVDDQKCFLSSFIDITKRKRAEEALRRTTRRFQTIVDNAPVAIYVKDRDGRFVFGNRPLERFTGLPLERLLGMTDYDFASKEDADRWRANDLKVMEGRRAEFEEVGIDSEGRPYVNLSVKFPLSDESGTPTEICGISTDITERKRAEVLRRVLLEQEKSRLGAAVEQASDSVVMVDLDGTIRYVNAAFESINGIARSAAAGTSYFDLLAGEPAAAGAIREAIASGRSWRGPLTRAVRDAAPIELEVTASPARDPSGSVIGGLVTEKNVTRENALQNQVRQAQKMEALGTLAGGITHDFNNILGAIVLNTELALLDLDSTNPARRPLPLVLQAANRGKELVKQIITFSRQRTWEKRPVEIAPIIQEGLRFLQTALPKDVQIQETIDARSGVVMADPSHINQVLVNLCQNAALAMPDGGRLEVVLAPVEVDEAMSYQNPNLKPGPYARLTVSDTGSGMTKEVQARIFEPFFTTRPKGTGSGLGLAVVHGIVRTYDGEVTVASEPGKGSRFNIYFPRLEGRALPADAELEEGPQAGQERILLVEDELAQRQSLESGLGRFGYKVTSRADGRSALEAFKRDRAGFDIVITDQIMPRMTGLELASKIAALRPGVPVILCTGFSEKVDEENLAASGVRELLMKPFTLLDVTRLVRQIFK